MALISTLIDGVPGFTDDSLMVKTEGGYDNEDETCTWVEYRLIGSDVIVHRSVAMVLKKMPVFSESAVAQL